MQCRLDMEVFGGRFAPHFGITRRDVGTEPLSPMTDRYNQALRQYLPPFGLEVVEIPRLESDGAPVSASRVRKLLAEGDTAQLSELLPETTLQYLNKSK